MPLSTLLPLLSQTGVQCFSLQKSPAGRFGDATVEAARLVDFTGEWTDFADSAAMVENLDLVIGVDSAVIHLAGALGKPAWLMLPPNPDWRWGLAGETSYWYPTLRLFRRGHGEPREAQVARIVDALAAFRLG